MPGFRVSSSAVESRRIQNSAAKRQGCGDFRRAIVMGMPAENAPRRDRARALMPEVEALLWGYLLRANVRPQPGGNNPRGWLRQQSSAA
jgi:hypothetical protein